VEHGTTTYAFDTAGRVIEEVVDPDSGTADDEVTTTYVYAFGRHLAKVVTEDSVSETFFYLTDQVGSTVGVTDSAGGLVWNADASPFGEEVGASGTTSESLKYTGKDVDPDTGLYYFNARWYDSSTGRFTSEDPVRDGVNWFVYVSNNPLRFVDPTGLRDVEEAGDVASSNDVPFEYGYELNEYTIDYRRFLDEDFEITYYDDYAGGPITVAYERIWISDRKCLSTPFSRFLKDPYLR
jgi:RHS repeat-associated protein